jgi:chaperonin GroEL
VELGKESCTIVGDGSTQAEVAARVKQINVLISETDADYEKEKLKR